MAEDLMDSLPISKENVDDCAAAPKKIMLTTAVNGQQYVEEFDGSDGYLIFVEEPGGHLMRGGCSPIFMANVLDHLLLDLREADKELLAIVLLRFKQSLGK